jgi:hypothetical protein
MADEKDHSAPDSISRDSEAAIPGDIAHLGPEIHETTLSKGLNTYTGKGYTSEEADKKAGDRYRRGEKDED